MVTKFSNRKFKLRHLVLGLALALSLAGCGSDDSSSNAQSSVTSTNTTEPFIMNGVPVTMVQAGVEYHYQPSATNPWGRVLAYTVVNKPDWAIFNEATGELSGTPEQSDVGTSANIEIGASDGTTTATVGPFRIRVIPELRTTSVPTMALTVTGTPAGSATAGQQYRFLPVVANAGGEPLSFSILNRPTWTTFNTATGLLVGTPKSDNVGTYSNIVISVSVAGTPVSLAPFAIRVQEAGSGAPTISGSPATTVAAGDNYSFAPAVTDPSGNALTFSVMNAPSWTSFNASTGELSGIAPSGSSARLYSDIVISVADASNSVALAPFSIEVQASSGGGGGGHHNIKFHPGMYIEIDPGTPLSQNLGIIASLKGSQGVVGVMLIQSWSNLEFAENVYTGGSGSGQGFDMVDQILAACRSANLQFILGYEDRAFGGNTPSNGSVGSEGVLPQYFDTLENGQPGYLDAPPGTTFNGEGLQMIADVTNPAVTAREIALVSAYGHRYDSNPNFEMFRTPETANSAFGNQGQYDQYVQQLIQWMAAARAAFPTTGISISTNFLDSAGELQTLFNAGETYAIGFGGPDVTIGVGSNPFPGTDTIVFNGYMGSGGIGQGTIDYRNKLMRVAEAQTPDESGTRGSMQQFYDQQMTGTLASGGSLQPNYYVWSFDAGYMGPNAFTNNGILAFIASVNGATNTTRPSTY
jgi:hypothetical protein